jgi:hypothetical protein
MSFLNKYGNTKGAILFHRLWWAIFAHRQAPQNPNRVDAFISVIFDHCINSTAIVWHQVIGCSHSSEGLRFCETWQLRALQWNELLSLRAHCRPFPRFRSWAYLVIEQERCKVENSTRHTEAEFEKLRRNVTHVNSAFEKREVTTHVNFVRKILLRNAETRNSVQGFDSGVETAVFTWWFIYERNRQEMIRREVSWVSNPSCQSENKKLCWSWKEMIQCLKSRVIYSFHNHLELERIAFN